MPCVCHARILYADTDVTFMTSPDEWMRAVGRKTYFQANGEHYTRGFAGINSRVPGSHTMAVPAAHFILW